MYDYNTSRNPLRLREFGRNVQKLAEYITTVEDKAKRSEYAATLIELMKQVVPTAKTEEDNPQRLWDDMHIISNFKLDIDAPFEEPPHTLLTKKPEKVKYNTNRIRFRHYGKNIELLVEKILDLPEGEEREKAIIYLGSLIKAYHQTWNRETPEDTLVLTNIKKLSRNELDIDIEKVQEDRLFEALYKEKPQRNTNQNQNQNRNKRGGGGSNKNRRRR
jgi:Domain of unknown function (DUF4290)